MRPIAALLLLLIGLSNAHVPRATLTQAQQPLARLSMATATNTPAPAQAPQAQTAMRTPLTTVGTALSGHPPAPKQEDISLLYALIILGVVALAVLWMRRK